MLGVGFREMLVRLVVFNQAYVGEPRSVTKYITNRYRGLLPSSRVGCEGIFEDPRQLVIDLDATELMKIRSPSIGITWLMAISNVFRLLFVNGVRIRRRLGSK
jgi:hypothetical protein